MAVGERQSHPLDDEVIFSLVTRHSVQFPLGLPFLLPKSLKPHFTFCEIILLKTSKNIDWRDKMSRKTPLFRSCDRISEERLLPHVAMVAKFLDLNTLWSRKYGRKNTKKLTCMTFLCMAEVRNKTAYTFLPPFGNVNGHLYQEQLSRSRTSSTLVT